MPKKKETKISRKRARKATSETPEDKRKRKNREKMQRYRDKLKNERETLAAENDRLKARIIHLNHQIDILTKENEYLKPKADPEGLVINERSAFQKTETSARIDTTSVQCLSDQSKISKLEKVFKRENRFWKNTLPRLIEKNPEKVKFTLMDQNKELSDLNGKARILFLKSQFRKIIQNVLPFNTLCIMYNFESINISEWVKLKEELAKPNPDLSKIKASPGFKERKVSSQFTKFFSTHGERIVTNLKRIKNQIHELVKIRNRIFKSAKTIDDIIESSEYRYSSSLFNHFHGNII
ncbi:unnamed protein product [Moneuplotes crassus]|uniref:BZIP domain-containing protein n=1 Tax=Euplotes crassus TaxID=5936 RepID=A0AAD1U5U8_EUPCR|nr:unnamed protein product [Moneuplotes crassus]